MRTRCPVCSTVFRVTSEQLRLRAGKVRCGHCQAVFNAFDELVSDDHEPLIATPSPSEFALPSETLVPESDTILEIHDGELECSLPVEDGEFVDEGPDTVEAVEGEGSGEADDVGPESGRPVACEAPGGPVAADEDELIQAPLEAPLLESPEESTQAARQAGLVAARELNETSSFNRWSAGTLASDGLGDFDGDSNRRPVWPFALVILLLIATLLGQLLFQFRTDIVLRFPSVAGLYELVSVDVPLPRNAALVSIETSDLQFDNARALFVLQATLKNRASYAQAWPALELSLTDTNDAVVSRRVIFAADYLPLGSSSDSFPANGEMAVKLWVEAKESGASGYRLYIFYP